MREDVCIIPRCSRAAGRSHRGLCIFCYRKAEDMVNRCQTTWDELVKLNMALPSGDPFTETYKERTGASAYDQTTDPTK